jgi:RND family efflux transporter MFP subunit
MVLADSIEGFTEPVQTIDVAASELGIIAAMKVTEGQHVKAGELLAELDIDVLQSTLEVAQAKAAALGAIEGARAERDFKQKRLLELDKLMVKGHATSGELARAEADLAVAEARLKVAQEEAAMAELECRRIQAQIERRRIRSPITGLVTGVHREVGEAFLANDPRIVTLVNLSKLRVRFQMLPQQAVEFSEKDRLTLQLPDIEKSVNGVVELISPVMDAKSGTLEVSVLIDNEELKLRSGARCTVNVGRSGPTPLTRDYPTRAVQREE